MKLTGHKTESVYRRYAIADEFVTGFAVHKLEAQVFLIQRIRSFAIKLSRHAFRASRQYITNGLVPFVNRCIEHHAAGVFRYP